MEKYPAKKRLANIVYVERVQYLHGNKLNYEEILRVLDSEFPFGLTIDKLKKDLRVLCLTKNKPRRQRSRAEEQPQAEEQEEQEEQPQEEVQLQTQEEPQTEDNAQEITKEDPVISLNEEEHERVKAKANRKREDFAKDLEELTGSSSADAGTDVPANFEDDESLPDASLVLGTSNFNDVGISHGSYQDLSPALSMALSYSEYGFTNYSGNYWGVNSTILSSAPPEEPEPIAHNFGFEMQPSLDNSLFLFDMKDMFGSQDEEEGFSLNFS